jgi:cob(I)alamin adenosyltransferase
MKIYTRTGDDGHTGLFGGGRVRKDDRRVEAYGAVDELNAALGMAIARLEETASDATVGRLRGLQADLFAVGAHLATPRAETAAAGAQLPELPDSRVGEMEGWIDALDETLEPLRSFILPGGTDAAAALHFARTVCRRAERRVVSLARDERVEPGVVIYLNRLSDLLFSLARAANRRQDVPDVTWDPNRRTAEG